MKKTLAITSLYANPIHPGHIECLRLSKQRADELWVIVNNDEQAKLKRGVKSFQSQDFRLQIVDAVRYVDLVHLSIDTDKSVCKTLEKLIKQAQDSELFDTIIFTKGGDRFANEIPEKIICDAYGVEIIDGLGTKDYNSSELIAKINNPEEAEKVLQNLEGLPQKLQEERYLEVGNRPWGMYFVLESSSLYKVKKIIVHPGCRLSLQSHKMRSEHWVVVSGVALVDIRSPEYAQIEQHRILLPNQGCHIPMNFLHRLTNIGTDYLVIIEIQCGEYTGEDDIIRYADDFNRVV